MVKLHAGLVYEYVCRFVVNVYASSANVWLTGVLIVHVPVLVPVHDALLTNATVAATVWLAGVLIVHVPVLVPVHDAFLRNATVVKLPAGLVYEYVYRFAVNVYASSANDIISCRMKRSGIWSGA
jgi:hypothetical protein